MKYKIERQPEMNPPDLFVTIDGRQIRLDYYRLFRSRLRETVRAREDVWLSLAEVVYFVSDYNDPEGLDTVGWLTSRYNVAACSALLAIEDIASGRDSLGTAEQRLASIDLLAHAALEAAKIAELATEKATVDRLDVAIATLEIRSRGEGFQLYTDADILIDGRPFPAVSVKLTGGVGSAWAAEMSYLPFAVAIAEREAPEAAADEGGGDNPFYGAKS